MKPHSQLKHRLVFFYSDIFSTAIRKKFKHIVYLDPFAGPGKHRLGNRIVLGSALLSLQTRKPFTKYIFGDIEAGNVAALRSRVNESYPNANCDFVTGDFNENFQEYIDRLPRRSAIVFCFLDPWDLGLEFSAVRALASAHAKIDFFILVATHMDVGRNVENYIGSNSSKIEKFLGLPGWRRDWLSRSAQTRQASDFVEFLEGNYIKQMADLSFGCYSGEKIRSEKGAPLYRLVFFSRDRLGIEFMEKSWHGAPPQRLLGI